VSKPKKKRVGFVIDMTPLVDITFLLLTFFMFTAKFKTEAEAEQQFVIERPESSADTSKVPEVDLATVKIAIDSLTSDTLYYYAMTNEMDRDKVWASMNVDAEYQGKALIPVSYEQLSNAIKFTMMANSDTKFAIDADKSLRFKWVSDAMNALRKNRATKFNYVTAKKGGGL
jgi:biopolymer transport protein ExbD